MTNSLALISIVKSCWRLPLKVPKKHHQFFLIRSQLSNCRYFSDKIDWFDDVQVQRYLNFISNSGVCKKYYPTKFEHISNLSKQKQDLENELINLEKLNSESDDDEWKKLVESNKKTLLNDLQQIKEELLNCIVPEDENDDRNAEIRIIDGIGGQESKIFRDELIQMYLNYAEYKNWEIFHAKGETIFISGAFVYGNLKHEGGVHRVQRVPSTERKGRIHSSTCSVIVLPQPRENEIEIPSKDIIFQTMRSSGPGGQHVQKTESCVQIKHIPTGIIVECSDTRYQHENRKYAMQKLKSILFNIEQTKIDSERKSLAKSQAGVNDYSDKIRTYNFPQHRVTDHRINYTSYNLNIFLEGRKELDLIIGKLADLDRQNRLQKQMENTLKSDEYKEFEKQQQMG